ncbi:MAG: hypothetical protein IPK73_01360 [Candidatus Obscuribacter sp.]|nr:hypothetical protein [Candidatus Obscuribacter sp.]MBK9280351.1 hypothetical protein [Candidatus Obscuribacter sp.]
MEQHKARILIFLGFLILLTGVTIGGTLSQWVACAIAVTGIADLAAMVLWHTRGQRLASLMLVLFAGVAACLAVTYSPIPSDGLIAACGAGLSILGAILMGLSALL